MFEKLNIKEVEIFLENLQHYIKNKNHISMFTEEEIQSIINSLSSFKENSFNSEIDHDLFYPSKEFFCNLTKYIFFPVLTGVVLLVFSIKYLKNIISQNYYVETSFLIYNPHAKVVQIAGDFTNWEPVNLSKKNGIWHIKINLKRGQYKYIYIIDGKPSLDPQKEIYEDEFGNKNSIIYV